MAEKLDVYRSWLGITEAARPLNYYQLLRVNAFTDDTAKIRSHYRKMNAHVRKFATGDYSQESQELLNELARAMLCLTDVQRKREYDASLGRKDAGEGQRRSIEEILLADSTIDQAQLTKARDYANAVGLNIRDALVRKKMASADVIMLAYAESLGLPYIELEDIGVDEELASRVPPTLARQHSCVPVMADEGQLLMASPNPLIPDVEEELRLRFEMPVRTVLCTAASIHAAVGKHYPRETSEALAPAKAQKPVAAKAKSAPTSEAPTEDQQAALSPEEKLVRRRNIVLVTFNVAVILYIIFRSVTGSPGFTDIAVAILLGSVAAAAGFVVAKRTEH
jgi:hypothetical protein